MAARDDNARRPDGSEQLEGTTTSKYLGVRPGTGSGMYLVG